MVAYIVEGQSDKYLILFPTKYSIYKFVPRLTSHLLDQSIYCDNLTTSEVLLLKIVQESVNSWSVSVLKTCSCSILCLNCFTGTDLESLVKLVHLNFIFFLNTL